jgi:NADPH-dependent 2,4-dienoyl-CoA reductase/sulfur reductase-like enzyme
VFLAAVGIRPDIHLAAVAGLAVNRGVLVDDRMRTSVPGMFAAGHRQGPAIRSSSPRTLERTGALS